MDGFTRYLKTIQKFDVVLNCLFGNINYLTSK